MDHRCFAVRVLSIASLTSHSGCRVKSTPTLPKLSAAPRLCVRHLFALAILVRAVPYVTKTQARFVTLGSKNFSEEITWLSNA